MPLPRYIGNIPGHIAYNKSIPAVVRDTYVQVRGLGWGKPEFSVRMEVMVELTGKSQSTLYEHLRLLEKCKTLRWSITNGVAIFKFNNDPPSEHSENSEGAFNIFNPLKDNNLRESQKIKKGESENSELQSEAVRALTEAYIGWVGYDIGAPNKTEKRAIAWLAAHFSIAQIKVVYDEHKASPYWEKKLLKPSYLRTAVPEFFAALDRRSHHAAHQPEPQPASGILRNVGKR
jgi:hypothetical protein